MFFIRGLAKKVLLANTIGMVYTEGGGACSWKGVCLKRLDWMYFLCFPDLF